jgi:hypothetical protein
MSRQADHHRQQNVIRLRERAAAAPIAVGYDAETHKFTVCWSEDPETILIAARHEVVAAYIDGFVRGYINRTVAP